MAYEIGDDVVVTMKWRRRSDGALLNPTAIQVLLQPPNDQALQTLVYGVASEITKIADGHYELLVSTSATNELDAGRWTYWVTSTGTGKASQSGSFVVEPPALEV